MKYVSLLLIFSLIFTACAVQNEVPKVSDFRRGTEGVEFTFQPNRPPDTIFEGDKVPVSLAIQNKGASHITEEAPVTVTVSYDNFYLSYKNDQTEDSNVAYSQALLGKSIDYPFGQEADEFIIGFVQANRLQGQVQSPETNLFVNICYPYQTVYHTQVCVNSDVYLQDERQEICETKELLPTGGQGAPIAVTKVVPRISLIEDTNGLRPIGANGQLVNTAYQVVRPVFEIHIENKNDGITYAPTNDVKEFCKLNTARSKSQINKVKITATLDASENNEGILDCDLMDPKNNFAVITLRDGKGQIYCTPPNDQTIIAEYNYFAQLSITLDYIYSEGKTKELEVYRKSFE